MKTYLRLLQFIRPHLGVLLLGVGCMVLSTAFHGVSLTAIIPLADKVFTSQRIVLHTPLPGWLSHLVEVINAASPLALLTTIALFLPGLIFLKGLFEFFQSYLMNDAATRIIRDIRGQLFGKFTTLSLDFFTRQSTGALVSRIIYDVGVVQNSITEGIADGIYQLLQVALCAGLAFAINWKMALWALVLLPCIALPIARVGRMIKKLSVRTQETMGQLSTTLYEAIAGMQVVQGFGQEQAERDRFQRHNQQIYKLSMKSMKRMNVLAPLTELVGAVGGACFLWIGGRGVIAGEYSLGVFLVFLGSLLSLIHPFKRLSQLNAINQQALAAAERIFQMLDAQSKIVEPPQAAELPALREAITFDHVWFSYQDAPVLHDITLTVRRGERVAFVGQSGVGKTTLVNLLPRFYDPTRGEVRIDGTDIRGVTVRSLRAQIAIVPQEVMLFNDTVRANIAYGRPEASLEEVTAAARQANAHEFIARLPRGYDTPVGEQGALFSGGERQRLAIARALLTQAPILILDEATSQLDAAAERLVAEAVERLMEGRTVLMIAHRLSTIRHASRIVVLHQGRIAEFGDHEALLAQSGLYRKLYELQVAFQ
ncbi:MAG: ABC transporter ATP-binding protein [Candidatus Omnitrophica bacterium]|nr:ABC transporter ATP-binding protein [Candidatus Omnitrophota bacterium]